MEIIEEVESLKSKPKSINQAVKKLPKDLQKILIALYRKDPTRRVQSFLKLPKPWVGLSEFEKLSDYIDRHGSVNHRGMPKDEVVIDVDSENKTYGKWHLAALENRWNILGYKRDQYDSGGDGYHCHFSFKKLESIHLDDLADVKNGLISYLCDGFMFMYWDKTLNKPIFTNHKYQEKTLIKMNYEIASHICLVNKTMIQIEYSPHRKGGVKKPYITDLGFTKTSTIEGKTPRIPKSVLQVVSENKVYREKVRESKKFFQTKITDDSLPSSIRFYLGEEINNKKFVDFQDGTKRAMFHLISFFGHTKPPADLEEFIIEWLTKVRGGLIDSHGKRISISLIRAAIRSNKGLVGRRARYQLLQELGCEEICE